jgi:hypothetical protein
MTAKEKEIKENAINSILELFGNGEKFPPLNIGNNMKFFRNFDYCASITETNDNKVNLQNFATQLGMTEFLGTKDGISLYKTPYKRMDNKDRDTKAHAKANNLIRIESIKEKEYSVIESENEAISKEQRKLNKQGYATYSSAFNSAMLNKFPNSTHPILVSAKSINQKLKEQGKLYS